MLCVMVGGPMDGQRLDTTVRQIIFPHPADLCRGVTTAIEANPRLEIHSIRGLVYRATTRMQGDHLVFEQVSPPA